MNFGTKLIVSIITISATVVGSIWGGFEVLDMRMESKVEKGKQEVVSIITNLKNSRDLELQLRDQNVSVQLVAIKEEMSEMRKDVRAILRLSRDKVVLEKGGNPLYTNMKQLKEENSYEIKRSDSSI